MLWAIGIIAIVGIGAMIYRREWILPILVVVLPLERIPSVDFWDVTIRPSNILVLGAVALLAWDWWQSRQVPVWLKADYWLLIYLAAGIFALKGAPEPERGLAVAGFTVFVMVVFGLTRQLTKGSNNDVVVKVLLVTSGLVAAYGLYQYLGDTFGLSTAWTGLKPDYTKPILGFPRAQSTLLEPLYLADFLIIPLAVLMVAMVQGKTIINIYWQRILLVLIGLVFILTVSRGAYLGFVITVLVVVAMFLRRGNWRDWLLMAGYGLMIAVASFYLLSLPGWLRVGGIDASGQSQSVQQFTQHATTRRDTSAQHRLSTSGLALEAWRTSPWIGIGLGNYGPYAAKRQGERNRQIVNNEALELLAETGVIGLGSILAFMGLIAWRAIAIWRRRQKEREVWLLGGLLAALAGILVHYQFFSTLYVTHIWFLLGWIAGVTLILEQTKRRGRRKKSELIAKEAGNDLGA